MTKAKLGATAMVATLALLVAVALAPTASAANGRPGPVSAARHTGSPAASPASALSDIGSGALGFVYAVGSAAVCVLGAFLSNIAKVNQVDPSAAQVIITVCSAYLPTAAATAASAINEAGVGVGSVLGDLNGTTSLPLLGRPGSPVL